MIFRCCSYGTMKRDVVRATSPHDAAVKHLLNTNSVQLDVVNNVQVAYGDKIFYVQVVFSAKTETIWEEPLTCSIPVL